MPAKKKISGLTPGTWAFRFRPKANDGRIGDWSGAFNYTVLGDTTPPPVPSKPTVEAVMGGVFVKWVESLYDTPIDFNRVDVYVSTGGAYTKFGSIATINGGITYSAPEGVTGPFTFKFTGVDRSGNVSAFSEASNPVSALSLDIDTTPPSVPSGLTVLAYNDPADKSGATGYVDVSWTGSTSADLLGHYIRYGRSATVWDAYEFMQKGQTTKRITNLRSGTTYYFQINATDGSNPSAYIPSTPVTATIPGDTTGPAAPSGLVAVAGFNNIIAYWNRNTEGDVDLGRGTYQFQLSTSGSFSPLSQDRTITGTVASFTGLTTGTTYYVRVRAIDSSGNIGAWSATATAVPGKINAQSSITDGTIVGDLVAANTLVGDKLIANTIDADRLKTNTGIVGKLFVGDEVGANKITIDGTSSLPAIYYGVGSYNNSNTPFYFDALGKFSLKDQLSWDGNSLTIKGSLNVTQASTFTGNVTLNSGGDIILNGGAIRATGSAGRVEIGSLGVYGYNSSSVGTPIVRIDANTGQLFASGGTIGGWTINQSSLTAVNANGQTVGMYSNGQLYMGPNFSVSSTGAVTITGTVNIVGTGSNVALSSDLSSKVGASEVYQHIGGTNTTTISGGIINTGTINLNNVNINSGTGGARIALDSTGLKIYNSGGTPTVSLNSNGTASFTGTITSSDIISGTLVLTGGNTAPNTSFDSDSGSGSDTSLVPSNSLSTQYNRTGLFGTVTSVGLNAVALISTTTAGVVSSWYPYWDGGSDLGVKYSPTYQTMPYRWRNLRLTGSIMLGGDGWSDSPTATVVSERPLTRLYSSGAIYANTLNAGSGTTTGSTVVQNSSGFLKVSGSSRKLKENIIEIPKNGYLDAVMQIKPVNFNYINPEEEEPTISGLIAEDLDLIPKFRGVVNYDTEGEPMSIAYDRMGALLVLAIQEIKDRLDNIEQRLDALS